MVKTADGRHTFKANKKGVALRIGILVELLQGTSASVQEMTDHLQSIHRSYNRNDVVQPLKQMYSHGIVQRHGDGKDATYSLTTNGKRIWANAKLTWK